MKSIVKHIPNFITSMNILCGIVGVMFVFEDRFDVAFILMLAAAVFDFLDGLSARLCNAYSDMGKELDSLCDVVSFGVLPSVMLCQMMKMCSFSNSFWCYVPVIIAVFSALRLAKFNVDERQHSTFIGLPTPACAMLCGALCYFMAHDPNTFLSAWAVGYVFIPLLSVILSALLVCEIPMFSIKFSREKSESLVMRKRLFFAVNVAIIIAITAALSLNWSLVILLSFIVYILMNVVFAILKI